MHSVSVLVLRRGGLDGEWPLAWGPGRGGVDAVQFATPSSYGWIPNIISLIRSWHTGTDHERLGNFGFRLGSKARLCSYFGLEDPDSRMVCASGSLISAKRIPNGVV